MKQTWSELLDLDIAINAVGGEGGGGGVTMNETSKELSGCLQQTCDVDGIRAVGS